MPRSLLSRLLSIISLLTWSGVLLYFYFSGRLNHYLVSAYRPLVVIAGFAMLGLAITLLLGLRRSRGAAMETALFPVDEFGANRGGMRVVTQLLAFGILVLPVATAVAVSSDSFGAGVVKNRGLVTDSAGLPGARASAAAPISLNAAEPPLPGQPPAEPTAGGSNASSATTLDPSQYLQTTPEGHIIVTVFDLLMAAPDDALRPDFEGRTVELVGQFLPDTRKGATGDRFNLVRMYMVCCAADARPIAVSVEPPKSDAAGTAASVYKPADMAWVKIVGKVSFPLENNVRTSIVRASSITPSDPPAEVMLY